jgi:hypothetical protein
MTTYNCKQCNAPAAVISGQLHKHCSCNAAIIANIQAVARGVGGVK